MSLVLDAPFIHHIEGTTRSWPLCMRCTKKLGRPFVVEVMGLLGRERPKNIGEKCKVIVEVECHGKRQEFTIDHPVWWTEAHFHEALGKTAAFVETSPGVYTTGRITREKR